MFVYIIQYTCWLYLILGILSYIYPIYGLLFHCIVLTFAFVLIFLWMLYICLLRYAVLLHKVYYSVVLNLDNLVMHISCVWFVMQFLSSSMTWIHKSRSTYIYLNYMSHALKHISLFLVSQYLMYLCLL